jgi:hypothetical protein
MKATLESINQVHAAGTIGTWVMSAEHLAAIALSTGRAKDHSRILQFLEQNAVDRTKMNTVLQRHGLSSKWKQFEQRFLRAVE